MNQWAGYPSGVQPHDSPLTVCVFLLSAYRDDYFMEFLLFPLLLYPLVLSQQLLIIIIVVVILWLWVHAWFLFFLLIIRFDERLRISILRKGIICQIYQLPLGLIGSLDLFLHIWLVVANDVHIVVVDWPLIAIPYLLLLDNLDLSILLSPSLRLSLHQLCLKIFLLQLINRSLSDFSLL